MYSGARSTLLIPMASLLTRDPRTIQPFSTTMRSRSESRKIRRKRLNDSGKFNKPVATEIRQYTTFYPAEDYHQDYDRKNPGRYKEYKILSGREGFIDKTWDESQEVRVYATPGCSGCRAVKEYLTSKNVKFVEINMAADEEARNLVIEKTGHIGSPVVQIGNEFIIGFDRKKMETLLKIIPGK